MTEDKRLEIAIVVAMDEKRGIGKDGGLPWPRIPEDMQRFRELTLGNPVIMGRKTFESLPPRFRPLPERPNIIITRDLESNFPLCYTSHTISEALQLGRLLASTRVCVIGGGEIYQEALSLADVLYLTRIEGDFNADTFFPDYLDQFPHLNSVRRSTHQGLNYVFEGRVQSL